MAVGDSEKVLGAIKSIAGETLIFSAGAVYRGRQAGEFVLNSGSGFLTEGVAWPASAGSGNEFNAERQYSI